MIVRKINIMKCLKCEKEVLLGGSCCSHRKQVFTGQYKVIHEIEKPDYFNKVHELMSVNKFFYSSH